MPGLTYSRPADQPAPQHQPDPRREGQRRTTPLGWEDADAWYCEWCDEFGHGHEMDGWENPPVHHCGYAVELYLTMDAS